MKGMYRYVIAALIVLGLIAFEVLQLRGILTYQSIIGNFPVFIASLVAILIFVIIGATFFGIFLAHRIISIREFTPFEIEMLKMRKDISDIKKKLEEMGPKEREKLGDKESLREHSS